MDALGNPIGKVDEFGNPIGQPPGYGTGTGTGTGVHGTNGQQQGHRERGINRSGSSSSSSSEDDEMGGRRKKKGGLKEKIKEKLPGGHKGEEGHVAGHGRTTTTGLGGTTAATTTTTTASQVQPEEKGFVEKIKEKLPGGHN